MSLKEAGIMRLKYSKRRLGVAALTHNPSSQEDPEFTISMISTDSTSKQKSEEGR